MLKEFQRLLKKQGIKYYIVPTNDDHLSEMIEPHFQTRAYLSGFNGSAGTLLVTPTNAYLWTDGRYFIQAAKQLNDGVELMKMGQKGVPTLFEFLSNHVKDGDVVAFDGETMDTRFVLQLEELLTCDFELVTVDLFKDFYKDRPARSKQPVFIYDIKYHGLATHEKIEIIQEYMKENDCYAHIISALDDIAWTYNLRGSDIPCAPVASAFGLITLDGSYLYLQDGTYTDEIKEEYKNENVTIKPYKAIYEDVKHIDGRVLLNASQINYELFNNISGDIVDGMNPATAFKCIKNDVEIKNTKNAHIKDGLAVTKFMYWLKKNYGKVEMDELSIADKVLEFRKEQPLFAVGSFSSIVAFKENAALMHYHANEDSYSKIEGDGLLLIDSGGSFYDGTTDITRTFVLGNISDIEKKHFTMVLQGMLALQNAHFLYGCTGQNLDILAREPMWAEDIDYQCGTGHGVGHFLNVHEGPQGIRWKQRFDNEFVTLEAGMITTDEPGIYLEGQYGIRLENELLCVEGNENEYGQFMHFECITICPIDLDGVVVEMLSVKEKKWLNDYHKDVYNKLSPFMNDEEKEWLKEYTREI